MDFEIKGGLSMNHDTTQSDWRTVASCLASQNYISIVNILRLAMKKSMTIDFFIAIFYSYREK